MGGAISVQSVEGQGASFGVQLVLPAATVPTARTAAPSPIPAGHAPFESCRVLLVEDNEINQVIAGEILARLGCRVQTAVNGVEAVNCIQNDPSFDLILMDCQMPIMDGYEATRRVRQLPGRRRIPIVALTANAITGDREACLEAGMDDYVTKPIQPVQLIEALERALRRKTDHPAHLAAALA